MLGSFSLTSIVTESGNEILVDQSLSTSSLVCAFITQFYLLFLPFFSDHVYNIFHIAHKYFLRCSVPNRHRDKGKCMISMNLIMTYCYLM